MASLYCITSGDFHVLECCRYPLKRTCAGCLVNSTRVCYMPVAITCMVRKWPGNDLDKGLFNYKFRDSSVDTPAASIYYFTTALWNNFCFHTGPENAIWGLYKIYGGGDIKITIALFFSVCVYLYVRFFSWRSHRLTPHNLESYDGLESWITWCASRRELSCSN